MKLTLQPVKELFNIYFLFLKLKILKTKTMVIKYLTENKKNKLNTHLGIKHKTILLKCIFILCGH